MQLQNERFRVSCYPGLRFAADKTSIIQSLYRNWQLVSCHPLQWNCEFKAELSSHFEQNKFFALNGDVIYHKFVMIFYYNSIWIIIMPLILYD